jgi:hypothetical protein
MDSKLERNNKEKVLRRVAKILGKSGFRRSKTTFFTRVALPVVEFVHLHKFTFGPLFRVHLGIRVVNDPFVAVALNGPQSSSVIGPDGRKREFVYGESEEALDRCANDIGLFVVDAAEPWFAMHRDLHSLASSPESPLSDQAREALLRAKLGATEEQFLSQTRALLNAP